MVANLECIALAPTLKSPFETLIEPAVPTCCHLKAFISHPYNSIQIKSNVGKDL
ncbi:hypothetical protein DPMN_115960 [Dreissena polymorpha]|uniref:Uncharacterized protein n=1 Tax=Dreissena polymorpha TaxID=45954 RepID=A0A9D4KM69_DREPO|nr:hypothetical protein DPMN_115960 [Dreissena polymorpha]